jgi:hypothetical protein
MHLGHNWQPGIFGQNRQYPHSIIYGLPLAICAAGAIMDRFVAKIKGSLTQLISVLDIPQEQITALEQASKDLRQQTLHFRMRNFHVMSSVSKYLSALIDPRIIRDLSLDSWCSSEDLNFIVEFHSYLEAFGPLRVSRIWDKLSNLTPRGHPMHLNEFKS